MILHHHCCPEKLILVTKPHIASGKINYRDRRLPSILFPSLKLPFHSKKNPQVDKVYQLPLLILSDGMVIGSEKFPGIAVKSFAFYQKVCVLLHLELLKGGPLPPQLSVGLSPFEKEEKQVLKKLLVALDAFINSLPFM